MKKIITLFLTVLILLSCVSCSGTEHDTGTPADSQTVQKDDYTIKIAVLNGTTGFGIAPLYSKLKDGTAGFNANIDFYADASLIPSLVISGSADIAAVPTNLAAVLYGKTGGKIRVMAVNTLGVLYLVENGGTVSSLSDLSGKTVCVPGQGSNPEYVLRALLKLAGLEDKVTIDYTYASPDELTTALAAGKAAIGVIPEPKVTAALSNSADLRVAADFSAEWKELTGTELVQGCLIARADFVEAHPALADEFLKAYQSSVNLVNSAPEQAAAQIVAAGLAAKEALIIKALPRCNITYMDGEDMTAALNLFWNALYGIIPASVGGALPDNGIFLK